MSFTTTWICVRCKQVPESWLAAHGPLDSYNRDALRSPLNGLATRKRARIIVSMIEHETRAGNDAIEKIISEKA